ncbi:hypothetical protein HDU67_008766 [Dinochytrium kinnereticum]|nr:hypothetical protein HDU67_008766 [Dinochytrium kinnereticum]
MDVDPPRPLCVSGKNAGEAIGVVLEVEEEEEEEEEEEVGEARRAFAMARAEEDDEGVEGAPPLLSSGEGVDGIDSCRPSATMVELIDGEKDGLKAAACTRAIAWLATEDTRSAARSCCLCCW